jgi:hypothetical protein
VKRTVASVVTLMMVVCVSLWAFAGEPAVKAPTSSPGMMDLLTGPATENFGWTFDNGREFAGATGKLSVDAAAKHNGKDSLRLDGDFTKGGNYVQAAGAMPDKDIREMSFWLRAPGSDVVTIRIVEAAGQCHQINLKIQQTDDWQQVVFPLTRFFAKRGTPEALPIVAKYEYWGGVNDGKWHGPGKLLVVVIGPIGDKKVRSIWLNDVKAVEAPPAPVAAPVWDVKTLVKLDEVEDGKTEWTFDNGQEFPGAKGSLTVVKEGPQEGQSCLKLAGDFTGGGAYVQTIRDLKAVEMKDLAAIKLKVKSQTTKKISIRLLDSTGQCHQRGGVEIEADGKWHDLAIKPAEVAGGEHWAGANDGKWHGPAALVAIIIGNAADAPSKQPVVYLADIQAEALQAAVVQAASFKCDFEADEQLPAGWTSQGKAAIDKQNAFKGKRSLLLDQPAEDAEKPCSVTTASFAIAPGLWEIALACRSDLKSPDNSFSGVVSLECLDASGKMVDRIVLADLFGQKNWQPISKRVEPAAGVTAGRFQVRINKASGRFWIDELSAARVSAAPKKDTRVNRILFASEQMGNLLFPEDKRTVKVTVVATKALDEKQKELSWVVRDYWGAELGAVAKVALDAPKRDGKNYLYETTLDLAALPLTTGRYYELHAEIAREGDEPFRNYTSLAILPKAVTKQYKPEEIPFTSRNWDGRIPEFFYLADRLGIRISNLWSGWDATPPYTPRAPTIEVCEKLGMGVISGSPTAAIENHAAGWEKYDEKALRQGVRTWIEKYGKVRPLLFSLGNEPPVIVDRLAANIAGYKAVYEEIKKIDPSIIVIATSVGPVEEFFKAGFHKYCDAVDFHGYSDWQEIPASFQAYEKLFAKYGDRKPIWSTEIGLNSQGLPRQAVARTLVKKLTSFFACGGANVSWFDLGYPDGDAKIADDSSSAHNVFDCRYSRYCPKLDALAYYNMTNGICAKKFVAQKLYTPDAYAFLFRDRDNHCLQVLWKEKGRLDATVPLPGVAKVTAIDIDGRRSELDAGGKGLSLTIGEDPVLLLYDSADAALAEGLGQPAAWVAGLPEGVVKGGSATLTVALHGLAPEDVDLAGPALWTIKRGEAPKDAAADAQAVFIVGVPETSNAREGDLAVRLKGGAGELRARVPVSGRVGMRLLPVPAFGDKPAGVRLAIRNYAGEKQDVTWRLALTGEMPIAAGQFALPTTTAAYFAEASEGTATLDPKGITEIVVPLAGIDPQTVYMVKASVSDASGRTVAGQRPMAGFVAVPRSKSPIKPDGSMAEADWKRATVLNINEARQYFSFDAAKVKWKGPQDLSGTVQFLWDDKYLYVGVKMVDDVFANNKTDGDLWAGDGLQFMVDPARDTTEKPGKYDLGAAITKKGPQAWCFLSADPRGPAGEAKEIVVSGKRANAERGDMTYVVAIPWSRVAPFQPAVGANLGMCVTINEDDGPGRAAFMTWFGDVQSKRVDTVGDLILGE